MKKVRQDGGLQKSQDLTAWFALAGAAATLPLVLATASTTLSVQFRTAMQFISRPDLKEAVAFLGASLWEILNILTPLLAAVALIAIIVNIIQGRGVFPTLKKLKPKFQNLNLLKGMKRVFGLQALWNGAKALLKTSAVGFILYLVIISLSEVMAASGSFGLTELIEMGDSKLWLLVWASVISGIFLSFFDALFIFKKNQKQTKMSKQELKEEYKSTEGNPEIKAARRQRQLQMARSRQLNDAANADVVVVNPTHYAIALVYEPGRGAPRVVAKGVDHLAARIREIALDNKIPQVQEVALVRTLYSTCDIGTEIPEELYTAVAQVLAFVMMIKRRGTRGGVHKMPVVPAGGGAGSGAGA